MTTFTIDSENNIEAHAEVPANADSPHAFATEKEVAKLSGQWSGSRLVQIWRWTTWYPSNAVVQTRHRTYAISFAPTELDRSGRQRANGKGRPGYTHGSDAK